jgi:hypothetical protein
MPQIKGIFTAPRFGAISPDGRLYIKGKGFGNSKGQIRLQVKNIANRIKTYYLAVNNWSDTKIKATMPGNISGVKDTKSQFILKTAKGLRSTARTVNFYATRETRKLRPGEAVKLGYCSNGADVNHCLGYNHSDKGSCFYKDRRTKQDQEATINAFHLNCDDAIDWDDGSDVWEVKLKHGWVIVNVWAAWGSSSSKDTVDMPRWNDLKNKILGKSVWKQTVSFEISPGKDWVRYSYAITVKGPKGVPTH